MILETNPINSLERSRHVNTQKSLKNFSLIISSWQLRTTFRICSWRRGRLVILASSIGGQNLELAATAQKVVSGVVLVPPTYLYRTPSILMLFVCAFFF